MKNKSLFFTLFLLTVLAAASCAGSRGGYGSGRKKGYGCPSTAALNQPAASIYSVQP